jgi:hypothetical protein
MLKRWYDKTGLSIRIFTENEGRDLGATRIYDDFC